MRYDYTFQQIRLVQDCISVAQCKTAVTPLLTHWSHCSLALSYSYIQRNNLIFDAMSADGVGPLDARSLQI